MYWGGIGMMKFVQELGTGKSHYANYNKNDAVGIGTVQETSIRMTQCIQEGYEKENGVVILYGQVVGMLYIGTTSKWLLLYKLV